MTTHAVPRSSRKVGNIAALTFRVGSGSDVQLLPAGEFKANDGRPMPWGTWKLTEANAPAVVAQVSACANEFVIDYEHQTQLADTNGQPAPAAGWFKCVEFRPGKGLYAPNVRWTARAAEFIAAEEYKYISAVFVFDLKTGAVQKIVCAALTNNPGLHGMDEVQLAALSARFSMAETDPACTLIDKPSEISMNPVLLALLNALGLPETEDTTAEQATGAVAALKASADKAGGLSTEIAALKAKAGGNPDATKWVPLEKFTELNLEVARLSATQVDHEVETLLDSARSQGKCSAVVEGVWREVGKTNIAQLKALIDKTPANPALAGLSQTAGKQLDKSGADASTTPTEDELAMCKNMGLTIEQFRAGA